MTTEFIITLVLLISALVALDYWLFRIQNQATRPSMVNALTAQWNRFAGWASQRWASLREKQQPPAASQIAPGQNAASQTESTPSQDKPEPAAGEASSLRYEVLASAGRVARVHVDAEIPPNTSLHITISTDQQGQARIDQERVASVHSSRKPSIPNLSATRRALFNVSAEKLAVMLFVLALLTYLLTRLIGLTDFPIYFFGDEAIQASTASDLIQRGMRGPDGTLLPTYFQNGQYFNLSVSVYLQVLPQMLFEKSIFVTRATSVLVTMFAAACVGLIMRNFLGGARHWWLATLLLSIIPAWFLHSRTAFETVLFVSFYAAFLYFYLEYRLRNPKRVHWAVVFAGLAFYSYSPGQLVLAVTGLFLLSSDLKYHWQQRRTLLPAIGLLIIFALPYLRFRLTMDYSPLDHLRSLGSYWIQPIPLTQKVATFLSEYLRGLSPGYWFFDAPDMARHQMRGYGNIPLWFAPFIGAGIFQALLRWKSPAHRLVLLTLLASPSGAALAAIGITRILVLVIPASLLTALGMGWMLNALENLAQRIQKTNFSESGLGNTLTIVLFTLLAGANFAMLADALKNGPTWYTDYGLYGMQYGAKQVYQETVVPALQKDPEARFTVTPSWANGAEHFVGFFVPTELQPRVSIGQIYDYLNPPREFTEKDYFVVTGLEFEKISNDPKFKNITVRSTIPYPNGEIGFYILNIQLQENIQELLAAEDLASRTPVESTVQWMDQTVRVRHSQLSGGRLQDVLDRDPYTLARGERDNPILYEFFFSQPITASQLVLTTGSMRNFDVVVRIYPVGEETPVEYTNKFLNLADDPTITIPFVNGPSQFDHVSISIRDNNQGDSAQVHVREIEFR